MKLFALALVLLFNVAVAADCSTMVPYGTPITSEPSLSTYQLCRNAYFVAFSGQKKAPLWVAEKLTPESLAQNVPRVDAFRPDPEVPKKAQPSLKDFVGSDYDRGHMAPADDMRIDTMTMYQSFLFTNIIVQDPNNNRGIWKGLEDIAQKYALSIGELYVISGPIFEEPIKTIGDGVAVPSKMYKILVDMKSKKMLVFIIPNQPLKIVELPKFISTLRDVEKATKIKFFPKSNGAMLISSGLWKIKGPTP